MKKPYEDLQSEALVAKVIELTREGKLEWEVSGGSAFAEVNDNVTLSISDMRWQLRMPVPELPGFTALPRMPTSIFMTIFVDGGKTVQVLLADDDAESLYEMLGAAFDEENERVEEEQRLAKDTAISDVLGLLSDKVPDEVVDFDFPAGTMVKIDGLPFWLASEATLLGHPSNVVLLRSRS